MARLASFWPLPFAPLLGRFWLKLPGVLPFYPGCWISKGKGLFEGWVPSRCADIRLGGLLTDKINVKFVKRCNNLSANSQHLH